MNYLVLRYTDYSEFQECSARILNSFYSGGTESVEIVAALLDCARWFNRSDHVTIIFQYLDDSPFSYCGSWWKLTVEIEKPQSGFLKIYFGAGNVC